LRFVFERGGNCVFLIDYMKTKALHVWAVVCLSALTAAAYRASADDVSANATAAKPDKTYTGTVVSLNPQEKVLDVKGFLFSKKEFNLGNNCAYTIVGKGTGAIGDLRPGQKVTVSYQDAHGVLVADRVTQRPMRDEGMVKAINPTTQMLTLHVGMTDKTFQVPADCAVVLRGDKSGTIADIKPGNHVTVTYEVPNGKPTAREIAQTSVTFTGKLTAIDLDQKTLKASTMFATRKFNVGDDCAVLVNGKPDGKLTDLRPGENLTFSYDDVNGVNIVNRIAPAGASSSGSVAEK
jgi:Cu/Ag efflux protein CusF